MTTREALETAIVSERKIARYARMFDTKPLNVIDMDVQS